MIFFNPSNFEVFEKESFEMNTLYNISCSLQSVMKGVFQKYYIFIRNENDSRIVILTLLLFRNEFHQRYFGKRGIFHLLWKRIIKIQYTFFRNVYAEDSSITCIPSRYPLYSFQMQNWSFWRPLWHFIYTFFMEIPTFSITIMGLFVFTNILYLLLYILLYWDVYLYTINLELILTFRKDFENAFSKESQKARWL